MREFRFNTCRGVHLDAVAADYTKSWYVTVRILDGSLDGRVSKCYREKFLGVGKLAKRTLRGPVNPVTLAFVLDFCCARPGARSLMSGGRET